MQPVLKVKDLKITLKRKGKVHYPVERVTFDIHMGESLALVGESGSGKSMTALSIMGLLQSWNSQLKPEIEGSIDFTAKDGRTYALTSMNDKEYDQIRGNDLSIIFQEPLYALNPVISIGRQVIEVILAHEKISKSDASRRAVSLLEKVGIPDAASRMNAFPHQFSGGQLQRIMIAMAIACDTTCLIADEPTTALDVTIQKQILNLLKELQHERQMSILLISHDLGVVSQFADKVAVMYAGNILEYGYVKQIFENPIHPYTRLLLKSIPTLDTDPTVRLLTKKDFLSDHDKNPGELVFDPKNRGSFQMNVIEEGHYASEAFIREVGI